MTLDADDERGDELHPHLRNGAVDEEKRAKDHADDAADAENEGKVAGKSVIAGDPGAHRILPLRSRRGVGRRDQVGTEIDRIHQGPERFAGNLDTEWQSAGAGVPAARNAERTAIDLKYLLDAFIFSSDSAGLSQLVTASFRRKASLPGLKESWK